MRELGMLKVRLYASGAVEEVVLGPAPAEPTEPRERPPTLSPLEQKQAEAGRIRKLALNGLGGVK